MMPTTTDEHRPEQFLGELEAAIMQILWQHDELTVRQVRDQLAPTRSLAYTTVMTVMSRLAQKGVLHVRKELKTCYYRATGTADQFIAQQAETAVKEVITSFGDLALAHFLREVEDLDPERLAALRALSEGGAGV